MRGECDEGSGIVAPEGTRSAVPPRGHGILNIRPPKDLSGGGACAAATGNVFISMADDRRGSGLNDGRGLKQVPGLGSRLPQWREPGADEGQYEA